jgi:hypothetical protein
MICIFKILFIFGVSNHFTEVVIGLKLQGLFLCPLKYGGGLYVRETGNLGERFDSVNGHRFFIGQCLNLITK